MTRIPPTPQIVADAILRARALIKTGHCKGSSHEILPGGKEAFCMSGALATATLGVRLPNGDTVSGIDIWAWAKAAVAAQLPAPYDRIPDFNDAPGTTVDMVSNVLSRAASAVLAGEVARP